MLTPGLIRTLMALSVVGSLAGAPVPVIYSTDLSHPPQDPDDHFDLACLYAMPEADLRAVILDQGDEQARRAGFKPVWQMNYLTGRHIPAAIGLRDKLRSPGDQGLDQPPEFQNGVNLILQTLRDSHDKVALIFVGSARDVVAAYSRQPGLFREKVRSVHGFIGDAGDPKHQEWNVKLDPRAFVGLMRSDLPFYWVPCFDGGLWVNNGHASFWRIRHGDVLQQAPAPLQRFFLYMLRHATNDPIAFLTQPTTAQDHEWMMRGERNLWCTALLGQAVGRPLLRDGKEVVGFSPVEVWADDQAVIHYGSRPGSRTVMRFEIKDRAAFAEAATRETAALLKSLPLMTAQ